MGAIEARDEKLKRKEWW